MEGKLRAISKVVNVSSDGGLVVLRQVDRWLGLSKADRRTSKIVDSLGA